MLCMDEKSQIHVVDRTLVNLEQEPETIQLDQ